MGNFESVEWLNFVPQLQPLINSRFSFFIENLAVGGDDMWLFRLFLQRALIIFVRLQISQFGSLAKGVNKLCFPSDLLERQGSRRGGSGGYFLSLPEDVDLVSTKMFRKFL